MLHVIQRYTNFGAAQRVDVKWLGLHCLFIWFVCFVSVNVLGFSLYLP